MVFYEKINAVFGRQKYPKVTKTPTFPDFQCYFFSICVKFSIGFLDSKVENAQQGKKFCPVGFSEEILEFL